MRLLARCRLKVVLVVLVCICGTDLSAAQEQTEEANPLPQLVADLKQTQDTAKQSNAYYSLLSMRIREGWDVSSIVELVSSDAGHMRRVAASVLRRVPSDQKDDAVAALESQLAEETSAITQSAIVRSLCVLGRIERRDGAARIVEFFDKQLTEVLPLAKDDEGYLKFLIRVCDEVATDLFALGDNRNGVRIWLMARRIDSGNPRMVDTSIIPASAAIEVARVARMKSHPSRGHAIQALVRLGFANKAIESSLLDLLKKSEQKCQPDVIEKTLGKDYRLSGDALRLVAINSLGWLAEQQRPQVIAALKPLARGETEEAVVAACSLARLGDATGLPTLSHGIKEFDEAKKIQLLGVIGHLGQKALPALNDIVAVVDEEHGNLASAAEVCIARIGIHSPVKLLAAFDAGVEKTRPVRCDAVEDMPKPAEKLVTGLLRRFAETSPQTKVRIALALSQSGRWPPERLMDIAELLKSSDTSVKQLAYFVLSLKEMGQLPDSILQRVAVGLEPANAEGTAGMAWSVIGAQDEVPMKVRLQILQLVRDDYPRTARAKVAHHLLDCDAVDEAIALLQHKDRYIRVSNLWVIGKRDSVPKVVREAVQERLFDPEPNAAINAASCLLRWEPKSESAIQRLVQLLEGPSPVDAWGVGLTRAYSLNALKDTGHLPREVRSIAETWRDNGWMALRVWAAEALFACGDTDEKTVSTLEAGLRSAASDSKRQAITAFSGEKPISTRTRRLLRLLLEDPDPHLQRAAWRAIPPQ